jgi:hypothetical protein
MSISYGLLNSDLHRKNQNRNKKTPTLCAEACRPLSEVLHDLDGSRLNVDRHLTHFSVNDKIFIKNSADDVFLTDFDHEDRSAPRYDVEPVLYLGDAEDWAMVRPLLDFMYF